MQINITEIMKEILLDGRMVDGYGFEPKHPIIYNTFMQSHLEFEEFLKSCLLDKVPDVNANQQTMMQYIKLYDLKPRDFNDLVEQLKNREKFGEIRNIDAIRSFPRQEFKAKFADYL